MSETPSTETVAAEGEEPTDAVEPEEDESAHDEDVEDGDGPV